MKRTTREGKLLKVGLRVVFMVLEKIKTLFYRMAYREAVIIETWVIMCAV
ncbi:MAG: hypothetical protein ETSY2_50405 [Candidatus Entotheonella gemina]|uniref:Uncharacterized protein n=1 Tax=Candidatus Entotheonella gemina TaxID=1429439 RepID=W4L9N7_9BACT|nr:MAG: hypothetical protein ETSY2_50405 [Candidatus Entotheonella gemina]